MRIIAFITEGPVIRKILGHLGEPTSPPRLLPARGPPLWEMAGALPDEIDPQALPAPAYEFDQRVAGRATDEQTDSLIGGDSCLRPPERQTSAAQMASGIDHGHAGARLLEPIGNLRQKFNAKIHD